MRPLSELNLSNIAVPPDENELRELEKYLGCDLPRVYREFIQVANGASPEADSIDDEDGEEWSVNNFFFVGPDNGSTESVVWNHINRWPGIPPDFLPIARDAGDNLFLMDTAAGHSDEVWIWVHDDPDKPLRKLADHFEEFIDRLYLNPDYI